MLTSQGLWAITFYYMVSLCAPIISAEEAYCAQMGVAETAPSVFEPAPLLVLGSFRALLVSLLTAPSLRRCTAC